MSHRIYEYHLKVVNEHIDDFKHVNNEVYVNWMLSAASAHSESLGYGMKKFLDSGSVFVVRRHELDYLLPAYLGEDLIVETWLSNFENVKCIREYQIKRKIDGKVIFKAKTLWVYINLKSGRPMTIPDSIIDTYRSYLAEGKVEGTPQ